MKITTPGRICLFGEHQDYLGLPVIALAISLRSTINAVKRNDRKIIINMPDLDQVEEFSLDDLSYTKDRDYFKSAIRVCQKEGLSFKKGFDSNIQSNIPIQAGTSSSSSIVVGWIKLISSLADNPPSWDNQTIGRLAYEAEVLEFGEPGGMMDQYSTALGGCIYLTQNPFHIKKITPDIGAFVLGNSNESKDTLSILRRCKDDRFLMMEKLKNQYPNLDFSNCDIEHGKSILNTNEQVLLKATIKNRQILEQAKKELFKDKLNHTKIGQLLSNHHSVLRDLLKVSTDKIDKMIRASLDAGALGAKINGSGGGGCMFAYAPDNPSNIVNAIKRSGGSAVIINGEDGVRMD
tara:strand:+ start:2777 stop:3823 length:1047 start_codon:yes stop_codon:yes gene_type:complete